MPAGFGHALALLAIVFQFLLPSAHAAVRAAAAQAMPGEQVLICTPNGLKLIVIGEDGGSADSLPLLQGPNCPGCLGLGIAAPPPTAPPLPLPPAFADVPAAPAETPCAGPAVATAPLGARAPPSA